MLDGVRVLFLNMPIREHARPNNVPLGPAILAARLRELGVDASILDLNAYRKHDTNNAAGRWIDEKELHNLLNGYLYKHGDQDLVCMSGLITTLTWQSKVARVVRNLQPHTFICSGGGLATHFCRVLFDWIPELDAVAHGEGDDVILKIAYDSKLISNIGIDKAGDKLKPYHDGMYAGRHRFFYDGGRPKDLDSLPYPAMDAFSHNSIERYIQVPIWGAAARNSSAAPFSSCRSLNVVSSRGCPHDCAFCYREMQGARNYGTRSADDLFAEIELLWSRYNLDFIGIVDDNFATNRKRIERFNELAAGCEFAWGTHARLDDIAREGMPELLARAGCKYIGFGAESASPAVLERMNKGGTVLAETITLGGYTFPRCYVEAITRARRNDIHSNCTWIMGYPGETLEDLKTSVAFQQWQEEFVTGGAIPGTEEFARARASVNRQFFTATAYPGTALFREPVVRQKLAQHYGIAFVDDEPVADDNLRRYVEALEDASKVLGDDGAPLNYSEMDDDTFLEARAYIDEGRAYKILEMR